MLSSNQSAQLFDHQYLEKESVNVIDFFLDVKKLTKVLLLVGCVQVYSTMPKLGKIYMTCF